MSQFAIVGQRGLALDAFCEWCRVALPEARILTHLFDRSDLRRMAHYDAEGLLIRVEEDPADFLEAVMSPGVPTGVVVRYEEVRHVSWVTAWSFLRNRVPILHHKQRNLLNLHAQRLSAYCESPFYLDPETVESEVAYLAEARREHEILLHDGQVLEVWHEEMADEPPVAAIRRFLGLVGVTDTPTLPAYPARSYVENYEELRKFLGSGDLGGYFD